MRLRTALALVAVVLAIAAVVWGMSGFLLGFFYAIPVVLIATIAAKRGEPEGRVSPNVVLWLTTRPLAFFVGVAWRGWIGGVIVLGIVLLLESLATHAHRRKSA
jgi:hypothetical protein